MQLVIVSSIAASLNVSTKQIQILNITASPTTTVTRTVIVHLMGSTVNLVLSYRVTIPNAVQPAAAYASVLATAVTSGKFTKYMQEAAAKSPNSTALLSATSSTVAVGNEFLGLTHITEVSMSQFCFVDNTFAPTVTPSKSPESSPPNSLSVGVIIGIIVGAVAILVIFVVVIVLVVFLKPTAKVANFDSSANGPLPPAVAVLQEGDVVVV